MSPMSTTVTQDYDLDYLQHQVRLLAALTSVSGPPPGPNVIAAGWIAADLLGQTYSCAAVPDIANKIVHLLVALCALAAMRSQPDATRLTLTAKRNALCDEALEYAACDISERLNELVNGSTEA